MHQKFRRHLKKILLRSRSVFFLFLSLFTIFLRKKDFEKDSVKNILVITQKRIGDTVVSIPALRAIRQSLPQSHIFLFANVYIRDILERIDKFDQIIENKPGLTLFKKAKKIREVSKSSYDLAIDLTCDYTLEGALLSFLSRAKFRVGYNTFGRGFLFHKSIPHKIQSIPMTDEILEIVRSIGLDTQDKSLKITADDLAQKEVRQFFVEHTVAEEDLLIGIHPGGHYTTQRWFSDRFADLADKLSERYRIKVILIGGPQESEIVHQIEKHMQNTSAIYLNYPIRNLLAIIQACHLLVCNNSGPLHLATALGTPTVSFMGPTLPERWWPQGENHVVLRKDLSCMPCNEGICKQKGKTIECLKLITVEEALKAVDRQLSKLM